jgi:hypothetical protein
VGSGRRDGAGGDTFVATSAAWFFDLRREPPSLVPTCLSFRDYLAQTPKPDFHILHWNPSPIPNVVDETRSELVADLARYALTF